MKKICALTIAIVFLLPNISIYSVLASASQPIYSDILVHEAKEEIILWSQRGILQGSDGMFRPDDPITRAEFAAVLNRVFGYTTLSKAAFSDIPTDAWYKKDILALHAAGIMQGLGKGIMAPQNNITAEQAVVMLARAFYVQGITEDGNTFADTANISPWAVPLVGAMIFHGYIREREGNEDFNPKANMTRAELVTALSNILDEYYNRAETYDADPQSRIAQNIFVHTADITLTGVAADNNLYIAPAVGKGAITLSHVRLGGNLYILGGGTVTLEGSFAAKAIYRYGSDNETHIENNTGVPLPSIYKPDIVSNVASRSSIVSVSPSSDLLFIKDDGSAWYLSGSSIEHNEPQKRMDSVKAVYSQQWVQFYLTHDDSLWGEGWNGEGQLGDGDTSGLFQNRIVKILDSVKSFDTNGQSLAIQKDNTLWVWGNVSDHFLYEPRVLMHDVRQISADFLYGLALKTDGTLWSWTATKDSLTGEIHLTPYQLLTDVREITGRMAIQEDGSLWIFAPDEDRKAAVIPHKIMDHAASASINQYYFLVRDVFDNVWVWPREYLSYVPQGEPRKIAENCRFIVETNWYSMTPLIIDNDNNLCRVVIEGDTIKVTAMAHDVVYAQGSVDVLIDYVKTDGSVWKMYEDIDRESTSPQPWKIAHVKITDKVKMPD